MARRGYWSVALLAAVLLGIIVYMTRHLEVVATLRRISAIHLAPLLALRVAFLAVNGAVLRATLLRFDIHLPFKECFGVSAITAMGNYLTPLSGGMFARGAYLKHRHSLPYAHFTAILASGYLVTFWAVGTVGLLASLVVAATDASVWPVTVLFLVVASCTLALLALPSPVLPAWAGMGHLMNVSLEGWNRIRGDKSLVGTITLCALANIAINTLSLWLSYRAAHLAIELDQALVISLLATLSIVVNVTPGNLGIQEGVMALSARVLTLDAGSALLAALILRASTIMVVFGLGAASTYLLSMSARVRGDAGASSVSQDESP